MKFCAVVVAYRPDLDLLRKNIGAYYAYADKVIVWRNSDETDLQIEDPQGKVVFMGEGKNEGISAAVNKVLDLCVAEGYQWLLTMDQDSVFVDFGAYLRLVEANSTDSSVAEFSPEVNEQLLECGATADKDYVITSGAFLRVDTIRSMGGFRSDFFLDGIDIDLGYKIRSNGYKVRCLGGALLKQRFGEVEVAHNHNAVSYPPKRIYNIIRNYWTIIADYFPVSRPLIWEVTKIWNIYTTASVIVYQKQKIAKLGAIVRGNLSGMKYILSSIFSRKK